VHDVSSQVYMADGIDGYTTPPPLPADEMARIASALSQG